MGLKKIKVSSQAWKDKVESPNNKRFNKRYKLVKKSYAESYM